MLLISRKYLPTNLIIKCLKYYEESDMFLKKNDNYEEEKFKLLENNRILYSEFEVFIEKTRGSKFSSFKRLQRKGLQKYLNSGLEYDFYFKNFLYVKLNLWNANISSEFFKVIKSFKKDFLIMDLRNSSGGYLNQTIKICNFLLGKCEIVNLVYKNKSIKHFSNDEHVNFKKIFVLVNNFTASSSEILAYSLKCNSHRTLILGNKTFGKNFGQERFINKKYNFEFAIVSFFWSVRGLYEKNITILPNDEIFKYIYNYSI